MRMYFCCTHVTLRATEVPLWIEAGLEVVPEEVDTPVLNRLEGEHYDKAAVHPALAQCLAHSTLSPEVWTAARRARIRQRKGLLSHQEQELFNASFDIIYIATDLETAVNVKSWFAGEVIFRYFGQYLNLRHIAELARPFRPDQLRDIICLPILSVLHEMGLPDLFDRVATVHGYIRPTDVAGTWAGCWEGQSAVVVQSGISEGLETTDALRAIAPLTGILPLKLLGKNVCERVPADIASLFQVMGILSRTEYLQHFLGGRFLVHPFANRYHQQYTTIEAIVAGMPVLFTTDSPLYLEQTSAALRAVAPEKMGAYRSLAELMEGAAKLYYQPQRLPELAARQRALLEPFSWQHVLGEAQQVLQLLRTGRRIAAPHIQTDGPHARIPCAEVIDNQNRFWNNSEPIPVYSFVSNRGWDLLEMGAHQQPILKVSPGSEGLSLDFSPPQNFSPGIYQFELQGHTDCGALTICTFAAYPVSSKPLSVRVVPPPRTADRQFLVRANLEMTEPFRMRMHVQALALGVELDRLAFVRQPEPAQQMAMVSADDSWDQLQAGHWTDLSGLVPPTNLTPVLRRHYTEFGLKISVPEAPPKIVLGRSQDLAISKGYELGLEIDARQAGILQVWLAHWSEGRVLGRSQIQLPMSAGRSLIPIPGTAYPGASAVAVALSLLAPPECDAYLFAVRLTTQRSASLETGLVNRLPGVAVGLAMPEGNSRSPGCA